MAFTRKNIKDLSGGVSQQPDSQRFDNQCTSQSNFLSDPIEGLTKRTGSQHSGLITGGGAFAAGSGGSNTFTHPINRNSSEQYMLGIGYDGVGADATPQLKLFDVSDGSSVTIVDADDSTITTHAYLAVAAQHATHPWSAVTIADHTYIANSEVVPAMLTTTSGGSGMYERKHVKRGAIFIQEGAYNANYNVKITDSEGTVRTIRVQTANSATTYGLKDSKTDLIAGALHKSLESGTDSAASVQFTVSSSPTYTDENTAIRYTWDDDSTDYICNKSSGGSNYSYGTLTFTAVPSDANTKREVTITDGTDSTTFAFTGAQAQTGGATEVTIGATALISADNLAAAINADADLDMTASVVQVSEADPFIALSMTTAGAITGALTVTDVAGITASASITGGHATPGSSTASVRNKIYFQREVSADGDTTGSVISWFASYPDEASAIASPIKVEVTDSYGDTMTRSFNGTTETFEGLPLYCTHNFLLKIEGNPDSVLDDYYVKFELEDSTAVSNRFGKGKWKESLDSDLSYQIDPSTMPLKLVKVSTTKYELIEAVWDDKVVGDATSDPIPSFIGKNINDVFYYKSRFGMLAGESASFSELNDAGNFWRSTVSQTLATDRVDLESSVNEITQLNFAVPFSNELMIFSDRTQFLVTYGNQGFTPQTAALSLVSNYECSRSARPVASENAVVFSQEKSASSEILELRPTGNTNQTFTADSISDHIPTYITGKVVNIRASSLANAVIIQTDDDDNNFYVYKYMYKGSERKQSAWSKYSLSCTTVFGLHFFAEKMHMVEKCTTAAPVDIYVATYMKLDNTDDVSAAIDITEAAAFTFGGVDSTYVTDWNIWDFGTPVVIDLDDNSEYTVIEGGTAGTTTVEGEDISAKTNLVLGFKFSASYAFSHQYLKRMMQDGSQRALTDGRTTTKWVELYFNNTQHLTATIAYPNMNRTTHSKTYTGSFSGGATVGNKASEEAKLRVMVAARNNTPTITLSSDSHQTVTITGAAFELMHTSRLSRTS